MRVALYARVSTVNHGQDPETQLFPLRDYAAQRSHEIVDEYVDLGWSGSKERRPNLDRLMDDARQKKFDAVLVFRFDRFARSTKHLITALMEFNSLGLHFVSISESIDTSSSYGKLVFTILAAVAELERELIRERVMAGVARARRQGRKIGRPSVLVDSARIVVRLSAGESVAAVAKDIGIARSTVRAIAERERGRKGSAEGGETPPEVDS